ncbi:hypothetical protein DAT35_52730 [Vitiosangium sp. GDMCC 1.1324]|nr:hypothetical protein DAT35_52730 [Vitiosangium sp. GDMCC 1.1324]
MALAWADEAAAQVDLSTLDREIAGSRAQVLVLGTVHLREMPKDFKPQSLEPVLKRLAAFKPDIITIEKISGEGCDLMARHPLVYGPVEENRFCRDTAAARTATGLDVSAAIAEVHKALKDWPTAPAPAQRRHLAALFLAADDSASALVQWLQLPEAERRVGDGLDDALVAALRKSESANDESYQIAARLAARLGLQRVFATDDHTGDAIQNLPDVAAYGKALQGAWNADTPQVKRFRDYDATRSKLSKSGDMLALYRYINNPAWLQGAAEADFAAALRERSPQRYGQLYVAGWETRNLRMVANIRAAFREYPGARVLSIVGASHKPWFDNLLGQMLGVDIVDAGQALK